MATGTRQSKLAAVVPRVLPVKRAAKAPIRVPQLGEGLVLPKRRRTNPKTKAKTASEKDPKWYADRCWPAPLESNSTILDYKQYVIIQKTLRTIRLHERTLVLCVADGAARYIASELRFRLGGASERVHVCAIDPDIPTTGDVPPHPLDFNSTWDMYAAHVLPQHVAEFAPDCIVVVAGAPHVSVGVVLLDCIRTPARRVEFHGHDCLCHRFSHEFHEFKTLLATYPGISMRFYRNHGGERRGGMAHIDHWKFTATDATAVQTLQAEREAQQGRTESRPAGRRRSSRRRTTSQ